MRIRNLALICLLAGVTTLMASGFALSGVGARAISMGGAMRGLGDDFTTIYWNPAGLAFLPNSQAALALANIAPSGDYTPALTDAETPMGWPGFTDGKTYDAEEKVWTFPNLYYTHQSESPLDWGVGVYVPYGLGATWDIFEAPSQMYVDTDGDGVPDTPIDITWPNGMIEDEYESSIGIVDFHPTASYQINDNMSVGLGLSVMYGMISITKLMPSADYLTYVPAMMELEGDGFGFGANFGFMWRAAENLRLGVSGKLPTSVKLDGDVTASAYLNDFIANQMMGANSAMTGSSDLDGEATVNLPADAGLGVSWWPMPQMVVACDLTWTGWSRLDYIDVKLDGVDFMGNEMEDTKMNTRWDDTMRYSLGAEYRFSAVGALDLLALRTGFYYDETPIPDETQDPLWPDVGDKSSFNFGVGVGVKQWNFDLGYEYMSFGTRELDVTIWNDEGSVESMAGEYNTTVNAFNASISYTF